MSDDTRRRPPVAGTYNFRDVGGYPTTDGRRTRWGVLFRSDTLHRLDDAGRATLRDLGVRTVVDLREDEERRVAPAALAGLDARQVHLPVYDGTLADLPPNLADIYEIMVDSHGDALAAALGELCRPDALPGVVHCSAGKDRTGIVIALALAVSGVPDDVIAEDYARSGSLLRGGFREEVRRLTASTGLGEMALNAALECPPELIRSTLERVRGAAGSVEGYLVGHGLATTHLDTLRAALVG